ncbi:RING-TYPE E3 UBIQUITIN TRANSFERASE [Salix koriyanagi]|uniref:RING-type E3 ubiquitin transferase n=1 Tax=Salix koriyanagi TaxID=2511006 RepID=A0A9Q0WE36_9ROSI|nr:RING-TYPE E3 UBIQUITIN TRANSFERASE [Salix koriyanagi]
MAREVIVNASVVSVSELLSHTVVAIFDTVHAAKEVLIQKDNFKKFSTYLEKTAYFLKDLSGFNLDDSDNLNNAVEILNCETKVAKRLAFECSNRNKIYLLLNCRKIVKHLEASTKEIGRALSLLSLASVDVSFGVSDGISKLCRKMQDAEYRAAVLEEEILGKIESAIKDGNVDQSYANNLLASIAEAVGISGERSALKREFEEFKNEIENVKLRKDMAEAIQMDRISSLLGKADATTSYEDREREYLEKRNFLGRQTLEPLHSFFCPITQDVMADPVETSSGKTYERSAIEKWITEGQKVCPLTFTTLDTSVLRPNITLRRSIEEWKERNNLVAIVSIKQKLQSNDDQEVLQSLGQLHDLMAEREMHQEWVMLEGYVPVLTGLLGTKNREIRTHTLSILCILAKGSDHNKEKIAEADHALEFIVRSLARQIGESKLALQLLLEVSKNNAVRDLIGNIQACIFLLVTTLNSEETEAARDAEELLENLSSLDENVIQMAKANYFKPLLRLLSSGPENVRLTMAATLAEIDLTDHKKVQGGPLFEILYRHSLSSPRLREQVAAIIMNLAMATTCQEANPEQISLLESEEDIFKFFCLISLTGPEIQKSILLTFLAMCQSPSGVEIRAELRQFSAVQVLVQLCEHDHSTVRANAMKLFCCLTEDGDNTIILEHVGQRCIETLLEVIKESTDVEEIAAAMGIISNLPDDPNITLWLVDSEAVQVISTCLTDGSRNASHRKQITENAIKTLCRFTENLEWQKRVAMAGIIPELVQLLVSGTALMKQSAAISLKQLSESSSSLSCPVKKRGLFSCFAAPVRSCPVHLGICTVESSFCILEANALEPLVRMLGEDDPGVCEASLDALLTLIDGEKLQSGSKVLAEANAIVQIMKLLSSSSARVQEKTVGALERIFRIVEFKQKYGNSAKMSLVDITQRGSSSMKSQAAKILAQLNVLNEQSTYF